jgi:hypothetical protein
MKVEEAVKVIQGALKDEGYYYVWQSNIAMAFVDEAERRMWGNREQVHSLANQAAKNFLTLLMADVPEEEYG